MSSTIFADNAQRYWDRGLSAIPLYRRDKRPIPEGWQRYSQALPPYEARESWLSVYPDSNIGLVLGPQSGLVMVDIDTTDQAVQQAILDVLPPSPWVRKGRKGAMMAYRFNGMKTFRIKDANGAMIVEGLSTGAQVVLPPSIHPDTGLPYVASCEICDDEILKSLHLLPKDIEVILRAALEAANVKLSLSGYTRVTEWVSRGSRDVQMVSVAGHYANGVLRGELTFNEAINRMVAWKSTCVEHIAGDDIDIDKGVRKLAEFLVRDVTGPRQKALPAGWDDNLSAEEKKALGFDKLTDEHVQWSYERLMNYITGAFTQHTPESPGRRAALEEYLKAIARSRDLSQIDEERLLRFVVQTGQMSVGLTALKARLTELRTDGIKGADHTEIANAMIERMTDTGTVAHWAGRFWQWSGSHWATLSETEMLRRIADEYGHLPAAKKNGDHRGIMQVASALCSRELRQQDEPGINFANGFLTAELRLVEHQQDYGTTYTLPYRYIENGGNYMPRFAAFMEWCWAHQADYAEKVQALREAIAATMFGMTPRFERAFLLFGPPKSGKSQMLKVIANLLPGESMCAIPPTEWADKFLPAQMAGKLLNICGELSERRMIDGMVFKGIISGEPFSVQHKGKDPFVLRPYCAHWFASNHLPLTSDSSGGFNRRWLMLSFDRLVDDSEKIIDLGTIIAAEEREAIVSWAVETLPALMAKGEYTLPKSHKELIDEVASVNNSVRQFLKDSGAVVFGPIVSSSNEPVNEQSLYAAYFSFAVGAGVAKPVSLKRFRQQMRELGSEFGFKCRTASLPNGSTESIYESLTLARKGGSTSRSGTGSSH